MVVHCSEAASFQLGGTLQEQIASSSKHHGQAHTTRFALPHESASLSAAVSKTLILTLPAGAFTALEHKAKERVTLQGTATNSNGSGGASATIAALRLG